MSGKNELSHQQSLHLIEQMIRAARNEHHERGEGWLIWGWLLFLASALSAVLFYANLRTYVGFVWTGMLVLGLLLYFFLHLRFKRREPVKTYVEELLDKFGTGFFISLFTMVAASFLSHDSLFAFGYYYILYAFWMFIHGSAIRFKPLIVGAIVNWAAAIVIFLLDDYRYMMIVSAVAVLIGYLIPGYMLRNQYKKSVSKTYERV